jgi:hypothetical protein
VSVSFDPIQNYRAVSDLPPPVLRSSHWTLVRCRAGRRIHRHKKQRQLSIATLFSTASMLASVPSKPSSPPSRPSSPRCLRCRTYREGVEPTGSLRKYSGYIPFSFQGLLMSQGWYPSRRPKLFTKSVRPLLVGRAYRSDILAGQDPSRQSRGVITRHVAVRRGSGCGFATTAAVFCHMAMVGGAVQHCRSLTGALGCVGQAADLPNHRRIGDRYTQPPTFVLPSWSPVLRW